MKPTVYPPGKTVYKPGVNDLSTMNPELSKEFSETNGKKPSEIYFLSTKNFEWICEKGHTWFASPRTRRFSGCPTCQKSRKTERKLLKDVFPELVEELVEKNLAENLSHSSHRKVEWICDKHTEPYVLSVNERVYGRKCPYCSFHKVLKGFNDLETVRPDLATEVLDEDNLDLIANSGLLVDWVHVVDGVEHFWKQRVKDRVYAGYGCLVCAGHKIQIGVNNFGLFLEKSGLHWSSLNDFHFNDLTLGSNRTVVLECHEHSSVNILKSSAKNFTSLRRVCQDCLKSNRFTSKGEDWIYDFVSRSFPGLSIERNVRRLKNVHEVDLLINDFFIVIDFNGDYWHQEGVYKPLGYHEEKRKMLGELGYFYFEVWESDWIKDKEKVGKNITNFIEKVLQSFDSLESMSA